MREGGSARLSRKVPRRASAALRLRRRTLMDWLCSCSARISLLMFPRSDWNVPSMSSIVARMASQLLICRAARMLNHTLSRENESRLTLHRTAYQSLRRLTTMLASFHTHQQFTGCAESKRCADLLVQGDQIV